MRGDLHTVILAGGSGVRFWPLSRRARPKQFLRLFGERSLIQATADRVAKLAPPERSWVVCGGAHAEGVRDALPDLPPEQIIVEPSARNTAAAVALACYHVAARDPEGVLVILPADHHIGDPKAFREALEAASAGAREGQIVTLGIQPTRAETGYGWLERGEALDSASPLPIFRLARFVEKPDATRAAELLASGTHLWNAGVFVFAARTMLDELAQHLPGVAGPLREVAHEIQNADAVAAAWRKVERISIDHGVMERTDRAACVPVACAWSDVGAFPALAALGERDAAGNLLHGDALSIDAKRCIVHAKGGRPVLLVGTEDLIVVDAGDAVLVVPRDRAQNIRDAVAALEAAGREELL